MQIPTPKTMKTFLYFRSIKIPNLSYCCRSTTAA